MYARIVNWYRTPRNERLHLPSPQQLGITMGIMRHLGMQVYFPNSTYRLCSTRVGHRQHQQQQGYKYKSRPLYIDSLSSYSQPKSSWDCTSACNILTGSS